MNKPNFSSEQFFSDDETSPSLETRKNLFSKAEQDLFHDDAYKPQRCFQFRRRDKKGQESWIFLIDKKNVLEIAGNELQPQTVSFFRTATGIQKALNYCKKNYKKFDLAEFEIFLLNSFVKK